MSISLLSSKYTTRIGKNGFTARYVALVSVLFIAAGCILLAHSFAASTCTTTLNSGANVSTALSSAAAGSTICLNAGSYSYNATVKKTSPTTVIAAPGVNNSSVVFSTFETQTSDNISFDTINITAQAHVGVGPDVGNGATTNFTLKNSVVTGGGSLCIYGPQNNMNLLIDNVVFGTIGQSNCGEGRLDLKGSATNTGITIKNSEFGPGGDSDGIQAHWGIGGVMIGPNNYFHDIVEEQCPTTHCDSIQPYGAHYLKIDSNYFYNDSDGVMQPDCGQNDGSPITITNNVFYQQPISQTLEVELAGLEAGSSITHNTFGPGSTLRIDGGNQDCSNQPVTLRDNILHGGCILANMTGASTIDHNLVSGGGVCAGGTGGSSGTPTYMGGAVPTSWVDWILTANSPGKNGASDGTDIGINLPPSGGGTTKPGDFNRDNAVDILDLSIFLGHWNQTGNGISQDLNNDNVVNILDLDIFIKYWNT